MTDYDAMFWAGLAMSHDPDPDAEAVAIHLVEHGLAPPLLAREAAKDIVGKLRADAERSLTANDFTWEALTALWPLAKIRRIIQRASDDVEAKRRTLVGIGESYDEALTRLEQALAAFESSPTSEAAQDFLDEWDRLQGVLEQRRRHWPSARAPLEERLEGYAAVVDGIRSERAKELAERTAAIREERMKQRESARTEREPDAVLCVRCTRRPRHFGDYCKRCANDLGVRPTGPVR